MMPNELRAMLEVRKRLLEAERILEEASIRPDPLGPDAKDPTAPASVAAMIIMGGPDDSGKIVR